jgi:hypothetical protein
VNDTGDLDLPDALAAVLAAGISVSYAQVWQAAIAARVPARRVGRYWRVRRADIPAVVAYFKARDASSPSTAA